MTITIHRSSDPRRLIGQLADVLSVPPVDPFEAECVAVPSRGIDRWIAQELSLRLGSGIAANIEFPTTDGLIGNLLSTDDGQAAAWNVGTLQWTILAALESGSDGDWLPVLAHHLNSDQGRRLQVAGRIAELFTAYQNDRPEMLRAWATGSDVLVDGSPVPDGSRWQPSLWRHVGQMVGQPSPAESLADISASIASNDLIDLPGRVCVYGVTRLPVTHATALEALATIRDVHVFVLHPSQVRWDQDAIGPLESVTRTIRIPRSVAGNRLLNSWGRDAVELQQSLRQVGLTDAIATVEPGASSTVLLARLQASIRADEQTPAALPMPVGDRSLQIHSCHGATRQVEVLRDALLHIIEADPTIQPRDIVIMCPDVERYAPLVEAIFSRSGGESKLPNLRVKVADRAPRNTNDLIGVLQELVELVDGRFGASEVVDFLALDTVGRGLGISEDELGEASSLIADANIRWGIDRDHRVERGLPDANEQTWQFGLDRLLAGVFLPDTATELYAETLPLAGLEGGTTATIGRLAEALSRLSTIRTNLTGRRSRGRWLADLLEAVEVVAATPYGSEWQWANLAAELERLLAPDVAADEAELTLGEIRSAVAGLSSGRPTRSGHRTGDLTVCTLVPMRSVPHRVIALLGMDDETFPRSTGRDGDDLRALTPLAGDRDRGSEDRQLLLDAVLAAGDHLIITYSGRDPQNNAPLPPAVPIAELLDEIDRMVDVPVGLGRDRVVERHPLHAFDGSNFGADGTEPWGFDALRLDGARAIGGQQPRELPTFEPIAQEAENTIRLADLKRFAEAPVRQFVRTQLGFSITEASERRSDLIPTSTGGLEKWAIGDRLLRAAIAGEAMAPLVEAAKRAGALPPSALGQTIVEDIEGRLDGLVPAVIDAGFRGQSVSRPIDIEITTGLRIEGDVDGVYGTLVGSAKYGGIKHKHLVTAFIDLAALTVMDPETEWSGAVVGYSGSKTKPFAGWALHSFGDSSGERSKNALAALAHYLDLYRRGAGEPLPIFSDTTGAFMRAKPGKALSDARKSWETGDFALWGLEDEDLYHRTILGDVVPFDTIVGLPLLPQDEADRTKVRSRFEHYAHLLWDPILGHLEELK